MFDQLQMWWLRKASCSRSSKDELLVVSSEEHAAPLAEASGWMKTLTDIPRPTGPRFPDGSINWQCPCMANGALVAHRCGHFFRRLYVCMSENDDVTVQCPEQFVDWSACMQNMTNERRNQMMRALTEENEKLKIETK